MKVWATGIVSCGISWSVGYRRGVVLEGDREMAREDRLPEVLSPEEF